MIRSIGLVVLALFTFLVADAGGRRAPSAERPSATSSRLAARFVKLPLRFEENAGQFDARVRYVARRGGASLFLTDEGATLALRAPAKRDVPADPSARPRPPHERVYGESAPATEPDTVLTLKVTGGRVAAPRGDAELETKANYLLGNDLKKWRTNVRNYGRVVYPSVLDGVDLVYHGQDGQLEYDSSSPRGRTLPQSRSTSKAPTGSR